jgi:hypothetical protein
MFIRFAITRIDEHSRRPQGVLVAAYSLLKSGDLNADERTHLREILIWFQKHLPTPPSGFSASRATFWFKPSAQECLRRVWELIHALRLHGYHVEVHKCRHLGNICYQDEFQVAAYPSNLDSNIVIQ